MKPVRSRRSHQNQRGVAIIEMAMVLPILTILVVAIVNFGLVLREFQILQNAAREGARFSSLFGNDKAKAADAAAAAAIDTAIKNRVVNYLAAEGITLAAAD